MSAKVNANLTEIAQGETYILGNLGVANGASGNGTTSPQCGSDGYLVITNSQQIKIPGRDQNNGNRRALIIFTMKNSVSYALQVLDKDGNQFMTINGGQVIAIASDADFIISGNGGTTYVTIGQVFFKNTKN